MYCLACTNYVLLFDSMTGSVMYIIFCSFCCLRKREGHREREKVKESITGSRQRGAGIQGNTLFLIIAAFHKGTGDSSILQHPGSAGSRRASRSHSHIPISTQTNRGSQSHVTTLSAIFDIRPINNTNIPT